MHHHLLHLLSGVVAALLLFTGPACQNSTPAADRPETVAKDAPKEHKTPARPAASTAANLCSTRSPIYNSKGVHNDCLCNNQGDCTDACAGDKCDAKRSPTDPPDPQYPEYWVSEWNMYRVFQGFTLNADGRSGTNLPPWSDPPSVLKPADYQKSTGATYYDDGYVPEDKDGTGAMMEHYDDDCLPIFPLENDFTCSFISLGNKAYFLTYEEDRPKDMPPCCMFSPYNHPPRRDFIKHLPYSTEDSSHVDNELQAYRYVTPGQDIWFAYGFWKNEYLDPAKKYLKPQSFYFSGFPGFPPAAHEQPTAPFAPFVSQNYTNFRIEKPDPTRTWDQVARVCTAAPLPECQLFDPPSDDADVAAEPAVPAGHPAAAATASDKALWSNQQFPSDGARK